MALAMCALIVTVGASMLVPEASLAAGVCALAVGLVGLFVVRRMQRTIALVLIGVGVVALAIGIWMGFEPTPGHLLRVNQDMMAMLAAVSFVQLITPRTAATPRLEGAAAVWRTAGALHVLGSVINISALNIVGDHLSEKGRLSPLNALLLSRGFSAAAFWSPFWGAAAAALAYAPGARVDILMLCGLTIAVAAMLFSLSMLVRRFRGRLDGYQGYVLTWPTLRLPLVLVVLVLSLHALIPDTPITRVVLLGALGTTVAVLVFTRPREMPAALRLHAMRGLPRTSGEMTLFAAAGVLAVGLSAFFDVADLPLPFTEYSVPAAWVATLLMALMSLIGVHPVISIAAVAAVVAPLHPDPTLLAMSGMIAWGASAAAGPISGLNVYLNGRYLVDNFAIARANLVYLVVILVLAWPVLYLCEILT